MGSLISDLQALQETELKLASIRRRRASKERQVDVQTRRIEKTDSRLDQLRRLLTQQKLALEAIQLEVNTREDSIAKHRTALTKARTNKEYANVLAAMNTEKADNAKFENKALELMEAVQQIEGQIEEIEAEKEKYQQQLKTAEAKLAEFDEQYREEREALQSVRDERASAVDAPVLNTFDRVAARHDSEAMAKVECSNPKRQEYCCSGCNMNLTLELVNALFTRDEIQTCDSCGRILYAEQVAAK